MLALRVIVMYSIVVLGCSAAVTEGIVAVKTNVAPLGGPDGHDRLSQVVQAGGGKGQT